LEFWNLRANCKNFFHQMWRKKSWFVALETWKKKFD
jgi:hypothetical protein